MRWMALAINSLPLPLSPQIRMLLSGWAIFSTIWNMRIISSFWVMISLKASLNFKLSTETGASAVVTPLSLRFSRTVVMTFSNWSLSTGLVR